MVLSTFQVAFAQEETTEETGSLTLSGSIDAYFRTNLNAPNKGEFSSASLFLWEPSRIFAGHGKYHCYL